MRFVAIGDRFTEGVGDALPDGSMRGWADLVAAGLAADGGGIHYANLAIRGRLITPIVADQLEHALALDPAPTMLSFNGGGNDMLRPSFGVAGVMARAQTVVDRCADQGVNLLILTGGDPTVRLPRGRTIKARGDEFLEATIEFAARHPHVTFVDNWSDQELRRAPYWSPDRLHLGPLGHARVAARVLTALGVDTPLPRADDAADTRPGAAAEARYWARYVLPWLARRAVRRSSGHGRSAKYGTWEWIAADAGIAKPVGEDSR